MSSLVPKLSPQQTPLLAMYRATKRPSASGLKVLLKAPRAQHQMFVLSVAAKRAPSRTHTTLALLPVVFSSAGQPLLCQ